MTVEGEFSGSADVLVIGSGIGGLSTAILLARSGLRVTVVEKNPLPGGLMRGYFRSGIECDVGIHYLGALGRGQVLGRLFELLGVSESIPVERMGRDGVIDRYLFEDFTFDLPEGLDAYEANLRAAFPGEGPQITGIMDRLRASTDRLNRLAFLFSDGRGEWPTEEFEGMGDFLSRLGCSPGLKAVLAVPCGWIGVPPDICPVFYHNMALGSYLLSSWRLKRGGSHMADVLAERFQELGGCLQTGEAVTEILVEGRRAKGIRLASGRTLAAPAIVGAVHPQTLLKMLPESGTPPLYRKRIAGLKNTHGILCVQAEVPASAHPEIPHNLIRIRHDENGGFTDFKFYQLRNTRRPDRNLLSILTEGDTDHWSPWENTRTGSRGRDYLDAKQRRAENLIRECEETLGPLEGLQLLDVYTPLTMRDWVDTPEGAAYGVLRSCEQMFSAALLNRASVKGLFLSGQSVMAPGILGTVVGSVLTARFILPPEIFAETILSKLETNIS